MSAPPKGSGTTVQPSQRPRYDARSPCDTKPALGGNRHMKLNRPLLALVLALSLCLVARGQDKPVVNAWTPQEKDRNRHEKFLKDKETALKNGPVQLVFI